MAGKGYLMFGFLTKNDMYIYFSTTTTRQFTHEALVETKPQSFLFSYEYKSSLKEWLILLQELGGVKNIMIDSGAFSAWSINKPVDRNKYLDFIYEIKAKLAQYTTNLYFVNLDVIPGEFGRKPNSREIEDSAKQGLENFFWFRQKGVETIHVYHQHEREEWLDIISRNAEYIGISPANDLTTKGRMPWLNRTFFKIRTKNKTHCFGGTDSKILFALPFYSADSSSYMRCKRFGLNFANKRMTNKVRLTDSGIVLLKQQKDEIIKKVRDEREATLLWKMRGVNWD
jgi:hypothetical protein